jgi:hypothetical protein
MINSYKNKYLKYKLKYNNVKFQIAGNKNRISGDESYNTDPIKAVEFYQKAVEEGDLEAHYKLGKMYENGIGVNSNIDKALDLYKKASVKGHIQSLDSFRENIFNIFLNKLFTFKELNDKNKVYFLIGTYPYIYKKNIWRAGDSYKMIEYSIEYNLIIKNILIEHKKKLIRDRCKNKQNNIVNFIYYIDEPLSINELELSNRIYYFIDNNYDKFYMNILKLYLTTSPTSNSYDILTTPFHLPIKFYEGDNYLKIHFTRLNIVLYIIKMFMPSKYSFENHITSIGINYPNQMSYTKKCILSNIWDKMYCNILNFLNNPNNNFYLLNDALWFFNANKQAENRYFEFFCEFGYILNKLYEKNKARQVFVVLPNNRSTEFFEFNNIIPKFTNLYEIYKYNFGVN